MRIAFLTPEFITDKPQGGGLGNYLNRMTRLLVDAGHEVEVLVSSRLEPRVLMHGGVRVERVPDLLSLPARGLLRILGPLRLDVPVFYVLRAWSMSQALERRHREAPFDLVQSADYLAVGLTVRSRPGRTHVVRCSCAIDLYNAVDGKRSGADRWQERLERAAIRNGDVAYAPSRLVAEHFRRKYGIDVSVVRPPVGLEVNAEDEPPAGLPERFLLHFGQLIGRKGTFWLADALAVAFRMEPGLEIVLAGKGREGELEHLFDHLGEHRSKVHVLGALHKPQLYSILSRADAAVLPSLVDNLPNTVIESLMFGIPVIGTRGASIDELVEEGVTGELVEPGDNEALARAMVRAWRGESPVRKGFVWQGAVADEMQPVTAMENLLKLAAPSKSRHGEG